MFSAIFTLTFAFLLPEPPEFDSALSAAGTVSVELGSDAVFACVANGDPAPTFQWIRYGERIDPDVRDDSKYERESR